MQKTQRNSACYLRGGYTLVEVMVVVVIMGVLSGIGVAGLRGAVANARIKDATYSLTAFMERTANEARRLNASVCVKRVTDQKLVAYKSACTESDVGPKVDSLVIEAPAKFIGSSMTGAAFTGLGNWYSTGGANFEPRVGLSAAPRKGYFAVQYGGQGLYGAALKEQKQNNFVPMMKHDEGNWFKI